MSVLKKSGWGAVKGGWSAGRIRRSIDDDIKETTNKINEMIIRKSMSGLPSGGLGGLEFGGGVDDEAVDGSASGIGAKPGGSGRGWAT